MKILDALSQETININLNAKDKKGVIDELAAPVAKLACNSVNVVCSISWKLAWAVPNISQSAKA